MRLIIVSSNKEREIFSKKIRKSAQGSSSSSTDTLTVKDKNQTSNLCKICPNHLKGIISLKPGDKRSKRELLGLPLSLHNQGVILLSRPNYAKRTKYMLRDFVANLRLLRQSTCFFKYGVARSTCLSVLFWVGCWLLVLYAYLLLLQ